MSDKEVFEQDEISKHSIKHQWPEHAVKNVWPMVKHSQWLAKYLPTDDMNNGKYPDREYFWGLCFTLLPKWSENYTH